MQTSAMTLTQPRQAQRLGAALRRPAQAPLGLRPLAQKASSPPLLALAPRAEQQQHHHATLRRRGPAPARAAAAAAFPGDGAGDDDTSDHIAPSSSSQPRAPAASPSPTAPAQRGVKVIPALIAVAAGLAVRFLVPAPAGTAPEAWSLFAIFLSTILGLVLEPLPVGAWAFCSLTAVVATGTLPFATALSAMTSEVIWLIVISFFFAKAFEKTGLGERVANLFVVLMGRSTLGLAYGLAAAETIVGPAMPSTTARAGGIFMPIIALLAKGQGSEPDSPSRKRLGAFLVQSQLQASSFSSNLFLTASAQNLLCLNMAAKLGAVVPDSFATWFIGASVPCLVGLALTPLLVYKLYPPEIKETPEAPAAAKQRLGEMGPPSRDEKLTLVTIGGAVLLWVFGEAIGCPAVLAAMLGLTALLCTGVLDWKRDCLGYGPAWDTLTWFAVLISMSGALSSAGLINTFAKMAGDWLAGMSLGWMPAFMILNLAFFTLHYLFASQTAHIGALFAAFTAMSIAAGVPPVLACLCLSYNGNCFGGITHFASGQAAIYYGGGYCSLKEFFWMGAVGGYFALAVFLVVGMPFWKFLGWF
jgi:DASS family divalent anion:Na+ symporter